MQSKAVNLFPRIHTCTVFGRKDRLFGIQTAMTQICVMSSHKHITICMEGLVLGVNTLYRLFCFFQLFPMVGKVLNQKMWLASVGGETVILLVFYLLLTTDQDTQLPCKNDRILIGSGWPERYNCCSEFPSGEGGGLRRLCLRYHCYASVSWHAILCISCGSVCLGWHFLFRRVGIYDLLLF